MPALSATETRRRIEAARVARLATVGPDGSPHLVPLVFALDGDRIYSIIDTKPKRSRQLRRLANIRANPRVALLVDHYAEDWSALWWTRADGDAQVVEAGPTLERAMQLLRQKYAQYRAPAGPQMIGPAILVTVQRWTGWSASR